MEEWNGPTTSGQEKAEVWYKNEKTSKKIWRESEKVFTFALATRKSSGEEQEETIFEDIDIVQQERKKQSQFQ